MVEKNPDEDNLGLEQRAIQGRSEFAFDTLPTANSLYSVADSYTGM